MESILETLLFVHISLAMVEAQSKLNNYIIVLTSLKCLESSINI